MDNQEYLSSLKNTDLRPGKIRVAEKKEEILMEDSSSEKQYLRAILGFSGVEAGQSVSTKNSAAWITKRTDNESYGKVHFSKKSSGRVYAAQVYEEATGVYVSNVFDGGKDLIMVLQLIRI